MTNDKRILSQHITPDGVTVTLCKPAKPRKNEKTWMGASKWSTNTLGAKAVNLRDHGLNHAKG